MKVTFFKRKCILREIKLFSLSYILMNSANYAGSNRNKLNDAFVVIGTKSENDFYVTN